MAENYFDQFGFGQEDEEQLTSGQPDAIDADPAENRAVNSAPDATGNAFDQFTDDPEAEGNVFDQYGFADPEPVEAAPEPEMDPSLWDQFVGGYYDERGRSNFLEAIDIAQEIQQARTSDEALEPDAMGGPFSGITRQLRTLTKEGREKFSEERLKDLEQSLAKVEEYRAKGEAIPFSEGTRKFLDENSDGTILEDFWAAPIEIIAELGTRSAVPSLKGAAAGLAAGLPAGVAGPGGAAVGFAAGMGVSSAREEYAATILEEMRAAGIDLTNPEQIVAGVADEELMERAQKKAFTRAAIIGGFDAVTGGVAGRQLVPRQVKGQILRELTNLGAQTGVQMAGGGGGEAAAQLATEGEVNLREVAAEAAGELITAPIDVGAAVVAGARGEVATEEFDSTSALDAIEEAQRRAEAAVGARGGDALEQAVAGAVAAQEVGSTVQSLFQEAAQRQITEEEYAKLAETPAAERTPVRRVPQEKLISDEAFAEAEARDEAARQAEQQEAAKRYEQQTRAAQAAPAEAQRAQVRETEIREAEYQAELQRGERAAQAPQGPTLGDVAPPGLREQLKPLEEPAPSQVKFQRKEVEQPAKPALEDMRPDVVVDAAGQALTKAQQDAERKRMQVDVAAGEEPLAPGDINYERRLGGLRMAIETPAGNRRTGLRPDGSAWSTTMRDVDYGFVRGTKGADTDQLDVFVSTKPDAATAKKVFVIDQIDQNTGQFDEHKAMVGFPNQLSAVKAYKRHYQRGWKVGPVTEMTEPQFKKWVKSRQAREPLAFQEPQPATEEDLTAAQERLAAKGRRKPKILRKLPEGLSIQMEEDALPSGEGSEISLELVDEAGAVRGGIAADILDNQKQIRVGISKLDEDLRGQKIGLEMYNYLLREAKSRGYTFASDTSVSAAAERIYEALERRGARVIRNPNARRNERGDLLSDDIRNPVFMVEPTDIQLRLTDVMAEEDIAFEQMLTESPAEFDEIYDTIENAIRYLPGLGAMDEEVRVLRRPEDIADEAVSREILELAAKGGGVPEGAYDADTGVLYIFTDAAPSLEAAVRTLLHEGVAHKGLRVVLGEDLPRLMDDIWENGNQNQIRRIADRYGLDVENLDERRTATEEYVAHLAERTPEAPLLRRVIDAIRQLLRGIGVLDAWTDNDIQSLLRDVRRELRAVPLEKIRIQSEVIVEETGEVVTVEQRADVVLRQHEKRVGMLERLRGCLSR